MPSHSFASAALARHAGFTLVELLVAMALGLLVVSVALASVLVARQLAGTTAEVSQMQQRAAYVFRIMGQQVRQAGSRDLKKASSATEKAAFADHPALALYQAVHSERAQPEATPSAHAPESEASTGTTASGGYALVLASQNTHQRALPLVDGQLQESALHSNCLGERLDATTHGVMVSKFQWAGDELLCAGSGAAHPIVTGVSDFVVKFMLQELPSAQQPTFTFGTEHSVVTAPADWSKVYAVKVCLELQGSERMDTTGSTYQRCDGTAADRGSRMRMVFRHTFHIHNQAW